MQAFDPARHEDMPYQQSPDQPTQAHAAAAFHNWCNDGDAAAACKRSRIAAPDHNDAREVQNVLASSSRSQIFDFELPAYSACLLTESDLHDFIRFNSNLNEISTNVKVRL